MGQTQGQLWTVMLHSLRNSSLLPLAWKVIAGCIHCAIRLSLQKSKTKVIFLLPYHWAKPFIDFVEVHYLPMFWFAVLVNSFVKVKRYFYSWGIALWSQHLHVRGMHTCLFPSTEMFRLHKHELQDKFCDLLLQTCYLCKEVMFYPAFVCVSVC